MSDAVLVEVAPAGGGPADRESKMTELDDLREALTAAHLGVWSWEVASDTIRWSDELCVLFGRDPGQPPSSYEGYLALTHPEDRERLREAIAGTMRTATERRASTTYLVEHRVVLADGTVRWIEGRGRALVDADGRPLRLTGTAADISARKDTEARLRASEERYRLFSALASDYVYVADFLNPTLFPEIVVGSFERTTGLTPEAVKARGGWWEVIHPDDRAALQPVVPQLAAGQPSVNEYRITDAQGQIRWLRDSIRTIADPATGTIVKIMGGVQDITERKRLEQQLLQAQKLEAVARLSGGVAHDFNNLLTVVMGSLAVLRAEAQSDAARECCQAIMEAANRGAELTQSLLLFARRDAGVPHLVNLGEVVRDAVPMLARAVGRGITVTLDGGHVSAPVRIDPGQAQLLLLNLAVNARDAMPAGGTLRLALQRSTEDASAGLPAELSAGAYARLAVVDEGEGIAPDVISKVFEPFFTTKPHGKGTGLGLAACHGIVQHARGAIEVTSVVGQGTTFTIFLPLVLATPVLPVSSRAVHSPGGTERLLLVEDEPQLQRIFAQVLRDRGYTVLTADSAEDALEVLERETVALLISDVVLPGIHGTELARRARARWPDMLILLTSGYAGAAVMPDGVPLLAKPFTVDRLAHSVRDVLDGARICADPT